MAVMYKLYENKQTNSPTKGKWYARAIHPQRVETNELAERIHHTKGSDFCKKQVESLHDT